MKAKDNPFSVERVLKINYRLSDIDWDNLIQKLEAQQFRGAIVGQHGSGKTTLLEGLAKKLLPLNHSVKSLRLNSESPNFSPEFLDKFFSLLNKNDIVLLDGAEQLNFISWQYFKYKVKKAKGLIITTHKEGQLPTIYNCKTNYQLLNDILFELIGSQATNIKPSSKELFDKHQGNIRDVLREYYDIYAQFFH